MELKGNTKDKIMHRVSCLAQWVGKVSVNIASWVFSRAKSLFTRKPKDDKKTILLVDDEVDLVDLMKFQLIATGYKVIVTHNGFEALRVLEKVSPDLIILDINMPEMGGVEFYNKISTGHRRAKYPVLVVTARANLEGTFKDVQIDGFMTKPFDIGQLVGEVQRITSGNMDPVVFIVDNLENPHVKQIGEDFSKERYRAVHMDEFRTLRSRAEQKKPDLIVLEYMQKEITGYEFIEKIKADPLLKDITLIVYSYTGFEEYKERSLKAGADKYVGKPKSAGDFLRAVKELQMERRATGE